MRLASTSLVLLCLFIWACKGAPPREDGRGNHFLSNRYTTEEDQFIIDELSNMLDGTIPIYSQAVWETLAKKYHEKWEQGNPIFLPERSPQSLLSRFKCVLIHNDPRNDVKVPEELMQKMMKHRYLQKAERVRSKESIRQHLYAMSRNGQIPNEVLETLETREKGSKQPYNKHEDNFIIEELSKPSCRSIFSTSTFEAIRAGHDKKRKAEIHGFKNKRTAGSIRKHLSLMKENGLLPVEILEKFPMRQKGASSSSSTTQNQESDFQVRNEQGEDDWIADMIEELPNNTDFEVDFSNLDSMSYL